MKALPLTTAERAEAATFLAAFPGEKRGADFWLRRFDSWWQQNPARHLEAPAWILRKEGAIAGFLGAIPGNFSVNGEKKPALSMTSWRVAEPARAASLELLYAFCGSSCLLVNTSANETVRKILRSLRFSEHAAVACGGVRFLPGGTWPFSWASAAMVPLRRQPKTSSLSWRALLPGNAPDAEAIDRLWELTKSSSPFTLWRDSNFYRWFCASGSPRSALGVFEGAELRATAIWVRRDWPGRSELELLDFWSLAQSEEEEAKLAAAALGGLRSAASDSCLQLLRLPEFSPGLRLALAREGAFLRRREDSMHFYYGEGAEGSFSRRLCRAEGDYAL